MARRSPAQRILLGDNALDHALGELKTSAANRAARSGLLKGARLMAKSIKAEIPSGLKSVRQSIGHKSGKNKRKDVYEAKAGAAVGKAKRRAKRSTNDGTGISRKNVHWWILGTDERRKDNGQGTGRMPEHPVVKAATVKKGRGVRAVVIKETWRALKREAEKLRAKQAAKV